MSEWGTRITIVLKIMFLRSFRFNEVVINFDNEK